MPADDRTTTTHPPDLEISNDRHRIDISLVHDFLSRSSYWALERSRAVIERSICNSLCFGAYQQQKQIAFARVITDRATFAYLADVFVIPQLRGRGVAKAVMRAVLDHPELQGVRMLLGTRDAHELYARFGFCPHPKPETMMVLERVTNTPSGGAEGSETRTQA